ncbi:MAG: acetylornithine deacetylase [Planctomycetota bacterium]
MASLLADSELLARLVAFDSTSTRSNGAIADFVSTYLADAGAVVERNESADGEKVNVVARFGPEGDDRREGLVLCGHLDVVPADEPGWRSEPFALHEREGNLYGRGTCDMKGFVALAMNVAAEMDAERLARPLVLLLTYDEELGSLGVQRLASTWPMARPLPRSVIVGEPTSLRVVRMHKGHLKMRIVVHGRSAHSGSPHLGQNAIEPAAAIVGALGALREELASERVPSSRWFDDVPFVVLNVARIHGGEAVNVIPDACVIDIGLRPLPGVSTDDLARRVEHAAGAAAPDTPMDVEVVNDNPPMLLDPEKPVCRDLCAVTEARETYGVGFASDAGILQREMDMECVLYGPGTIEVAHRPNEHVPIDEMHAARGIIAAMTERLCGAGVS